MIMADNISRLNAQPEEGQTRGVSSMAFESGSVNFHTSLCFHNTVAAVGK